MPEAIDYTPEFEHQLRIALAVPEPAPVFMDSLRSQFLSGASLTAKEIKMKPKFSRLAWGLALLALLALILTAFSSPTVVNALRRLLGYVPGVGVVEPSSSLRVLSQPVIQTRDGVTLTIEQAVAQSDKTIIVYQYMLDSAMLDRTPAPDASNLPSFTSDPSLRLPDGSELKIKLGQHLAGTISDEEQQAVGKSVVRYRMEFGALPQGIDHIVLLLPRLVPIAPGAGPEFWEIPLDLKASTGLELPVIEVVPTETEQQPASAPSATVPLLTSHPEVSLLIDKVVPLADGYILMGYTQWNLPASAPFGTIGYGADLSEAVITDANGQEIPYDYLTPDQTDIPGRAMWAYQVKGNDFHWPLTVKAQSLTGYISVGISKDALPSPIFEFDAGANPQPDQAWALDKSFTIAGYTAHVSSVRLVKDLDSNGYYYEFTMNSSGGISDLLLLDLDNFDRSGHGLGQINLSDSGLFTPKLSYDAGELPAAGMIQVGVSYVGIVFRGDWQVNWSPPGQ